MATTGVEPAPDFVRDYRIRDIERYRAYKRGKFTLWPDVLERLAFLTNLNRQEKITRLLSTFGKEKAFRLLDFLCQARLYVEISNETGLQAFLEIRNETWPQEFVEILDEKTLEELEGICNMTWPQEFVKLVRKGVDYVTELERKLSELPPLLSKGDQERLALILENTRRELEKHRKRAIWYCTEPASSIGARGKPASNQKSRWVGYFVRTVYENFIPEDLYNRYQLTADLATLCGLKTSGPNARGIILKGRT